MATSYRREAMRVNHFAGGLLPKGGVIEIEDKRITLYTGIPGTKGQKRTVIKFRDVETVYPVNILGIAPTGILIVMKDTTSYRLAVHGRDQFLPWLLERVAACQPKGSKNKAQVQQDEADVEDAEEAMEDSEELEESEETAE